MEKLASAEEHLQESEKNSGFFHATTIAALIEMAELHLEAENFVQALDAFIDARQRITNGLFEDHSLSMRVLSGLSALYLKQRMFEEAAGFAKLKIAALEKRFGAESPELFEPALSLGEILAQEGRFEEAQQIFYHVQSLLDTAPPSDINAHARLMLKIGLLGWRIKNFDAAIPQLEQGVRTLEQENNDPHTMALGLQALADCYAETNDLASAESNILFLFKICTDRSVPIERDFVNKMLSIFGSYAPEEKTPGHWRIEQRLVESIYGPTSDEAIEALRVYSECCCNSGAFEEAEHSTSDALQRLLEREGEDSPAVAPLLQDAGVIRLAKGDLDGAQQVFERALGIRENAFGSDHAETAHSLHALGMLYKIRGDLESARSYLERAHEIRSGTLGADSDLTFASKSLLDSLNGTNGSNGYAEPSTVQTETKILLCEEPKLEIPGMRRSTYRPSATLDVGALFNNAAICMGNQQYAKAVELFMKLLEILETNHGPNYRDLKPVLEQLAIAHTSLGNESDAEEYRLRAEQLA